mmetsp:Transcript_32209/g.94826  ORF Transcript_32209/g.94826 Transcript_32209/m.94826 type:complete len:245 (+) Transcript_32209:183-917(+)
MAFSHFVSFLLLLSVAIHALLLPKQVAALSGLSSSKDAPAAANPKPKQATRSYQSIAGMSVGAAFPQDLPGVLPPLGFFDPLRFAARADAATLKRYREAELTHGRVGMLAAVGFLVGERVEGSSFLFNSDITGPAIDHIAQVPAAFWVLLVTAIGAVEAYRAERGWVDPGDVPADGPGLLRDDYIPGDLGFDPLGFTEGMAEEDFFDMQTRELSHGRLGMIAAAGFLAQEAVDGKGIVEHWQQS